MSAWSEAIARISDVELNLVAVQEVVRFIMALTGLGSNVDRQVSVSYKFTTPVLDLEIDIQFIRYYHVNKPIRMMPFGFYSVCE